MTVAKQVAATNLSLPADTYIYQLANLDSVYVAISSDDSLTYFDPTSLALTHQAKGAHQGLTCISKDLHGSRTVVTAGRDGLVKCWDERCKGLPVQMRERKCVCGNDGLSTLCSHGLTFPYQLGALVSLHWRSEAITLRLGQRAQKKDWETSMSLSGEYTSV